MSFALTTSFKMFVEAFFVLIFYFSRILVTKDQFVRKLCSILLFALLVCITLTAIASFLFSE